MSTINTISSSPKEPLISVLMPVYNGERYLREAIESILEQSYSHFEFIIVNDGSTDKTAKILRQYEKADSRIHIIKQQNAGIVTALNNGLAVCKGHYIARMDADDICYPDRLKKQVSYLENDESLALLGGQADIINSEGQVVSEQSSEAGRQHMQTNMRHFPPKVVDSLHPLIMMRTSAIKAIGGYRSDFPHAEDYDLFIRISSQGRIFNPDDIILQYRIHENSISQKNMILQEKSAVLAELVAMWSLRNFGTVNSPREIPVEDILLKDAKISKHAFQTYQNYRLWKRTEISHLHDENIMRKKMIKAVTNFSPQIMFDQSYWKIRAHIFATFIYRLIIDVARKVKP